MAAPARRMAADPPDRNASIPNQADSSTRAISIGSVIGVACRYSTFGLSATTRAPASAATREPVMPMTRRAIAQTETAKETTDTATPKAPVR